MTTASYLILTPPGETAGAEKAAFIRDGFRWTAFFFPAIWLLFHRLWFWGILALVAQFAATLLSAASELWLAGWALSLSISILTALEGPQALVQAREARDWILRSVVTAPDLETAELIYYGTQETPDKTTAAALPASDTTTKATRPPALGLLGYDGD